MSFRSKRSRNAYLSKLQDKTAQSVEDIVSQVVDDIATGEAQSPETLLMPNHTTDEPARTMPTQSTTTEADDLGSNQRNATKGSPLTSSSSQRLAPDAALRLRASLRRSVRVQIIGAQPTSGITPRGTQALEAQVSSFCNDWTEDSAMAPSRQAANLEADEVRPNSENISERQPSTPPTSQPLPADSPAQPRASKRRSTWVEEDIEEAEPAEQLLSRALHSKPPNWSDDIKFVEIEEVEMRDLEGRRGRKGGSILPRHVWSLRPGVRFVVPFNSLDQPVRKGGFVLVRFLGELAKSGELCPIGEVNWHKVDKSCKADIIALVREKFVLPSREEIDKGILKHVGKKWRGYRYELKVQYKTPGKTQEQVANAVPKGVIPSQWVKLVQYWFSEKCQFLSTKGKEARAAHLHRHTTGSKSFARKRDEFEKENGREPGDLEWFVQTHRKKDGTYVEKSSEEFLDAAATMIARRAATSSSLQQGAIENQVFNELMYSDEERRRWPIGYGFGANRNKVFGVGAELRKRGYSASGTSPEHESASRNKISEVGLGRERGRSSYLASDNSAEVERLKFAMAAMRETNELMQSQLQMQSQQLKMQSQQLQIQSEHIEGLQFQLQQVTSLLTKFGVMLNNPRVSSTPPEAPHQRRNIANTQVLGGPSQFRDSESESSEWDSD